MNLDAFNDLYPEVGYRDGYDPEADPTYNMGTTEYYDDLKMASQTWWGHYSGRYHPPAPEYRPHHGRLVLGREMDPFACQAKLREIKQRWRRKLWTLIMIGGGLLVGGLEVGLFIAIPAFLVMLPFWLYYRHHYARYYTAQEQTIQLNQAVWVPFTRREIRQIKRKGPGYLWSTS